MKKNTWCLPHQFL